MRPTDAETKSENLSVADPRQFRLALARYEFVAKLFSKRQDVAEYGRLDPLGAHMVLQEVEELTVYGTSVAFIERFRGSLDQPVVRVHNVLVEPLPRKHRNIYSLNAMQCVSDEDVQKFVMNLWNSVSDDPSSALLLGSPAQEVTLGWNIIDPIQTGNSSGTDQSSKFATIHVRSGWALRDFLKGFFHSVILFSLVDGVLDAGISDGAQYVFAYGCGKMTRSEVAPSRDEFEL